MSCLFTVLLLAAIAFGYPAVAGNSGVVSIPATVNDIALSNASVTIKNDECPNSDLRCLTTGKIFLV